MENNVDQSLQLMQKIRDFSPFENKNSNTHPLNRYILRRNIGGFPFAEKVHTKDAALICKNLADTLKALYPNGTFYKSSEISDQIFHLLFEHLFISNKETIRSEGGVFIDVSNNLIAFIHLEDHLTVFFHHKQTSKEESTHPLKMINDIDNKIQRNTPFAFSSKFGYITSSALHLGTGLTIEGIIHAPAINFLNEQISTNKKVTIYGLNKEKTVLHNLLILSNKYCLGISEKNNTDQVIEMANSVAKKELEAKNELINTWDIKIKDTVSKSFGIVQYANSLDFHESLDLASNLDLGIQLGYIQSSHKTFFFDLFFSLRRAHLENFYSEKNIPIEEKRAAFFKEKSKDLKLCI